MTLILALDSRDGIILASDSQATMMTSGQQVKQPVEKIYALPSGLAWGGAGPMGLVQRVEPELARIVGRAAYLDKMKPAKARIEIRDAIARAIRPVLLESYGDRPGAYHNAASFVAVACLGEESLILEVPSSLVEQDYTQAGFVAIGSGDIFPYFALASLAHFNVRNRTLTEAKLIAYRVLEDAISVAAQGLGPPIQMIEIVKSPRAGICGQARKLSIDDLNIIRDQVVVWKELESETLAKCVGLEAPEDQP